MGLLSGLADPLGLIIAATAAIGLIVAVVLANPAEEFDPINTAEVSLMRIGYISEGVIMGMISALPLAAIVIILFKFGLSIADKISEVTV